ncbi:hypothetical protein [Blattabacterium cuenoti]|uniref:hypothetical protein n=1 Tax=Blattabacterium cuenoti TaxID=1653831 RepID=UPI00163B93D7|nr:hypothetical protein [Blattabacterium cuenoti]
MFRNILSVFIGVIISIIEILFAIRFIKEWFIEIQYIPIKKLKKIFFEAPTEFFLVLIFFYAFSALLGGTITALFAQNAKKAYAMLTGFILFFIALFHIFFYPFPLWFKIIILPLFFPFSYLGGNFIEFLQRKKWINQ